MTITYTPRHYCRGLGEIAKLQTVRDFEARAKALSGDYGSDVTPVELTVSIDWFERSGGDPADLEGNLVAVFLVEKTVNNDDAEVIPVHAMKGEAHEIEAWMAALPKGDVVEMEEALAEAEERYGSAVGAGYGSWLVGDSILSHHERQRAVSV